MNQLELWELSYHDNRSDENETIALFTTIEKAKNFTHDYLIKRLGSNAPIEWSDMDEGEFKLTSAKVVDECAGIDCYFHIDLPYIDPTVEIMYLSFVDTN